jgi:hypothetical protein
LKQLHIYLSKNTCFIYKNFLTFFIQFSFTAFMFIINIKIKSVMMMVMQWNFRIYGILYQWLHHKYFVSSIIFEHWLCLSFHVCSKTCCELLLQTVQCKTFCTGVQSNSEYYQEVKVGNGRGHVYTMRYRIGILCGNYHLSLPTVTPLNV